jgi:hypothetical protein
MMNESPSTSIQLPSSGLEQPGEIDIEEKEQVWQRFIVANDIRLAADSQVEKVEVEGGEKPYMAPPLQNFSFDSKNSSNK